MFRLVSAVFLYLAGCTGATQPKQENNTYDECDQIKIGPVIQCTGIESMDSFRCEHKTSCENLHMICDGYGMCYSKRI